MSSDKNLKLVKFSIRPMVQTTATGEQQEIEGTTFGVGVLQSCDMHDVLQKTKFPFFVRHHFVEHRMTRWTEHTMNVVEVQKQEGEHKRFCGSFITDENNNLVAYCVDSQPTRLAKGNKTQVANSIQAICTRESWEKIL